MGRISTVDLYVKIASFVKRRKIFSVLKVTGIN
jgi:hypothetical protein